MKSTKLKYTLERLSGMPETIRKLIASPSFLTSPSAEFSANNQIHTHHSGSSFVDKSKHKIDFSNFAPFSLSEIGENDIPKQHQEIAGNQFIDDSLGDQNDFIKEVDRRLTNMRRHYRSKAANLPSRRILVVGAGPVGLRCAIGAALAGNQVTIIEQYGGETRARYLGLFSPEQEYLAGIGAPKSMFTEVSLKGIPKRAVTLPDLQLFLKTIALKVGVEVWLNSKAVFEMDSLKEGAIQCVFYPSNLNPASHLTSQMTCLKDKHSKGMGQKNTVKFDVLVDATGAHSDLKRILFGKQLVGFRTICKDELIFGGKDANIYQSKTAPAGAAFLFDQANKINRWEEFVEKVLEEHTDIVDNIDCFVSNIDRSIFSNNRSFDLSNYCPPDWIWKLIPRQINNDFTSQERFQRGSSGVNNDIFRIQFEGPFPQNFKGSRTIELLRKKKRAPKDIIATFIKTSDSEAYINKEGWNRYCNIENGSKVPAQNTASLFNFQLTGIRTNPDRHSLWGIIPGTKNKEYFIAGDAAQSAWYRFGSGIMDGFYSASIFDELLRIDENEKQRLVMRWERYLRQRAVQVMYSIYLHEQLLKDSPFMHRMLEELYSDTKYTKHS
jgi:hypothetical protein